MWSVRHLLFGVALAAFGCSPSLTIPPSLARRVALVPIEVQGARFAETEIRFGDATAHDIRTTGKPNANPSGTFLAEDHYAFSYVLRVGTLDVSAVDCDAGFGFIDVAPANPTGPDVEMLIPNAVKIQLACNVRPLAADVPAGHLALKTREGLFNLAPAVLIEGDLDIAVNLQSSGVSATRGWTVTVGVDFSALTGTSVALLDLRGQPTLRMSQRLSSELKYALESVLPAFVLFSSYERLRMRSD
jgi:hypothetical protein